MLRHSQILIWSCVLLFAGLGLFLSPTIFSQGLGGCAACGAEAQRVIYAPTIGFTDAEPGNIVLNCRSEDVLETTPTFYTEDGQAIVGEPIIMQPREMRFVTIESLIPPQHRGQHEWGGVSLSYFGGKMEMWAQITIPGSGQRNSTEVLFSFLNGLGSDTLEAVWFQPKPGKRVVALGNSSDTTIQTHIEFSDGEIKDIEIAPHASKYLRRNYDNGSDVGESIKITTVGPAGALKASGYIISKNGSNSHKMASSIRFYDTRSAIQPKLFSTNFHVKNETLHLMLKNTSINSLNIVPTFRPTSGHGEAVILSPLVLSAGETRELDLQELRTASNTRDDLDSVSVEVANDGMPGTLIGSLNSKNEENGVAYDIPLRDSGPKRISTGSYPWRLDNDYKSIVTITNVGSDPSRFGAELRYPGGRYVFMPQTLVVGETAKFNLKKIRDEAIPDSDGNILSANATVGQFKWSILGMVSDTSRLIGRSEVISKSGRVSSSYSCNNNCPDSGPEYQVDANPISVFSADYSNNNVREYWHHEYGGSWSFASVMPNLHTGNTSIAESEMIPSSTAMRTDGYDAGDTYWYSGEYTYYYYYDGGSDCYMTPWYQWETSGPIEVAPTVQIQRNGQVIASSRLSNPVTQTVSIGDGVSLTTSVSNGTPSGKQWTVPGTRVAGYVVNYTSPSSSTSGTVTELTDLGQSSIQFYWVDGGDNRSVTYTVTVNGRSYSATAKFDVKAPSVTALAVNRASIGIQSAFGGLRLRYGDPLVLPGVSFGATIDNNGPSGTYQWVQIYNESKSVRLTVASSDPPCAVGKTLTTAGQGLDRTYPYVSGISMEDSPDVSLISGNDLVTVSDSASAWLMFKSSLSNSIWVPLRRVDWSWGGSVRRIPNDPENHWEQVPNTTYSNPAPSVSTPTNIPVWDRNITARTWQCQN